MKTKVGPSKEPLNLGYLSIPDVTWRTGNFALRLTGRSQQTTPAVHGQIKRRKDKRKEKKVKGEKKKKDKKEKPKKVKGEKKKKQKKVRNFRQLGSLF